MTLGSRRFAGLTAGTAALALVLAPSLLPGGAAQASLTPTHIGGLSPLLLKAATDLGPAPASATQKVTIVLSLRDKATLLQLLKDQNTEGTADYHRWLSSAEFTRRFAPSATAIKAAKSFGAQHGLHVAYQSKNGTLVQLAGTTAQVNEAFGVVEHRVKGGGQTFLTPDRTATLPASLRGITTSVLGLTTYQADHYNHVVGSTKNRSVRKPAVGAVANGSNVPPYQLYGLAVYGPRDFWKIYNAPSATTGVGQKVAIMTTGDLSGVANDLTIFQQRNNLPQVPLEVVPAGAQTTDTSGSLEYDLDSQYSFGFAPGVSGVVAYNGPSLAATEPLQAWADDNTVKTASASYGGCEMIDWLIGEVDADDQVFQQANAQGQSIFVSTGDEGSACGILINTGTPVGIQSVEYPASSPWAVAVGGTSLTGNNTMPLKEIAWIGGGGGYSIIEGPAPWQTKSTTFQPIIGRGVPDVSLDADSLSGYNVVVDGQDTPVGGTSASAPAWNGIWARALQAHATLGTAAPALYKARAAMVDIKYGSNGLWQATSGYDLTTGLGVADINKVIAWVR